MNTQIQKNASLWGLSTPVLRFVDDRQILHLLTMQSPIQQEKFIMVMQSIRMRKQKALTIL